jgi:spermidine synthase
VAVNTLGAAVAPLLAVIALPFLGTKAAVMIVSVAYLALTVRPSRRGVAVLIVAGVVIAVRSDFRIVDVPPGGRVLDYREGVMATVAVIEDPDRHRVLRVDNRFQMGGTAAADAESRQAHLPLLLHPAPQQALFLGLGTGISFGAASLHPGVRADGVELIPEVVEVMSAFAPQNFAPQTQPQLRTQVADARRYVRAARSQYDVVIGDLFHPYRDGAGALYTREHFAAVRERLATNGIFCQWLPLHQLDEATLKVIIRTFLEVFPETEAWLLRLNVDVPVIGLVGRKRPAAYAPDWIETRARASRVQEALTRLSLGDSVRFFGNLAADRNDLRTFSAGAPMSTDDNPRVTFMAPRRNYERTANPSASLFALLQAARPDVARTLGLNESEHSFVSAITDYMRARNVYLAGLAAYANGGRDEAIAAYVESARISRDFTAGYAQCLSIAAIWAQSDPGRARQLLQTLIQAQPERPAAGNMLNRISAP